MRGMHISEPKGRGQGTVSEGGWRSFRLVSVMMMWTRRADITTVATPIISASLSESVVFARAPVIMMSTTATIRS